MGYMDYVTRDSMANQNLQVLYSGDWDFEIKPKKDTLLSMPAKKIYQVRTKGIQGLKQLPTVQVNPIQLRGFTLLQPGLVQTKPDNITFDVQDFEDTTLVTWLWDWHQKMCNIKNLYGHRRDELKCDITITQLNSDRQPVWIYEYQDCLPEGSDFVVTFDSEKNALGTGSITFNSEFLISRPAN